MQLEAFIRDVPNFPKPGILFKDITPLLADPDAFKQTVRMLARDAFQHAQIAGKRIDVVGAMEARGFIFGAPLAMELGVGFVPFRKPGKLPFHTVSKEYELEYGTDSLEVHTDGFKEGQNVILVDDLLATGGTMKACTQLVENAGAKVLGCNFVVELVGLKGRETLASYETTSLLRFTI
jgi:adenine phosphoribosyltransferase